MWVPRVGKLYGKTATPQDPQAPGSRQGLHKAESAMRLIDVVKINCPKLLSHFFKVACFWVNAD